VYSPAAGTVLHAGMQTLSTTFAPTDTADYNTVTASVTITANPATSTAPRPPPAAGPVTGSGHLAVSDWGNHRVLEFVPPFSTGMAASLELGFPACVGMNSPTPFADGWTCPSDGYFCGPGALAFDSEGNLWVSDAGKNRILEFSPPFSSGMAASLVIGQPDFTSGSLKPTAIGYPLLLYHHPQSYPQLTLDRALRLWTFPT